MNWYLKVVRDNYANFEGRARRSEYWYFVLFQVIICLVLFSLIFVTEYAVYLYGLYALATLLPGIAVVVRRLHDIGKSGWFYFVALIPFIGAIWLLILLFQEGDNGPNEYGPDPKNDYQEFNDIGTADKY